MTSVSVSKGAYRMRANLDGRHQLVLAIMLLLSENEGKDLI